MNGFTSRLAIATFSLATLIAGTTTVATATPLQVRGQQIPSQQTTPSQRQIVVSPSQTTPAVPAATQLAPTIPPRPDNCAPDFSWFDYDKWEWICVGHW